MKNVWKSNFNYSHNQQSGQQVQLVVCICGSELYCRHIVCIFTLPFKSLPLFTVKKCCCYTVCSTFARLIQFNYVYSRLNKNVAHTHMCTQKHTPLIPEFCKGLARFILRTGTALEQYSSHDQLHFCLQSFLPQEIFQFLHFI